MAKSKSVGSEEIQAAIERLVAGIAGRHRRTPRLLLLGIANGGIELARRLAGRLSAAVPGLVARSGTIDVSFHRDDFGRNPIPREFAPTLIPADVNGATVLLVDDVLFSGRTVKAALDELFDHGRPTRVELAILADRGGRRLPIAADYCGLQIEADEAHKVVVHLDRDDPARDTIRVEAAPKNRQSAL